MLHFLFFFLLFWNPIGVLSDGLMLRPFVGCLEFPELGKLCGGHGRCVDEKSGEEVRVANLPGSKCICESGWTGSSDAVDMFNHSCTINIISTKILWVLPATCSFFLVFYIIYKLVKSTLHLQKLVNNLKVQPNKTDKKDVPELSKSMTSAGSSVVEFNRLKGSGSGEGGERTPTSSSIIQQQPQTQQPHLQYLLQPPQHQHQHQQLQPQQQSLIQLSPSENSRTMRPPSPSPPATNVPATYSMLISELLSWQVIQSCLFSLPICFALIILGITRGSKHGEEYVIGRSWLTTVCYIVISLGSNTMQKRTALQWMRIRGKVARFTEDDHEKVETALTRIRLVVYIAAIFDAMIHFLYLLVPIYPAYGSLILCIQYNGMGIILFVMGLAILHAGKKLEQIIGDGLDRLKGSSRSEREKALKNIQAMNVWCKQTLTVPPTLHLCALWPLFRLHVTYIMGMGLIAALKFLFLVLRNSQLPSQLHNPGAFEEISSHHGGDSAKEPASLQSWKRAHEKESSKGGGGGEVELGLKQEVKALDVVPEGIDHSPILSASTSPSSLPNSGSETPSYMNLPRTLLSSALLDNSENNNLELGSTSMSVRTLDDSNGIADPSGRYVLSGISEGGSGGQSGGRSNSPSTERDEEDLPIRIEVSSHISTVPKQQEENLENLKIFNPFCSQHEST